MGVQTEVKLFFVYSTYKITGLHYNYRCATLSAAYVGYLWFKNLLLTPHIWVSNLKCSLFLYVSHTVSLDYTTRNGAQLMLVTASLRIFCLHHTYMCATLNAADVCMFHLQNQWVTLHLWMRHLKCSLCWLPLPRESLVTLQLWVRHLKCRLGWLPLV